MEDMGRIDDGDEWGGQDPLEGLTDESTEDAETGEDMTAPESDEDMTESKEIAEGFVVHGDTTNEWGEGDEDRLPGHVISNTDSGEGMLVKRVGVEAEIAEIREQLTFAEEIEMISNQGDQIDPEKGLPEVIAAASRPEDEPRTPDEIDAYVDEHTDEIRDRVRDKTQRRIEELLNKSDNESEEGNTSPEDETPEQ